ncbi:MAG: DUF262 domain-containing protein [Dehalococcoidia bacterium]|nr:DUF262 domain-containing protein [Dehalococcoidia bacterium]
MTRYRTESQMISELVRLQQSERLIIQPKFQRRAVWSREAQSFLVDTIVRAIPMPKIYVRVLRQGGQTTFEVVDGQQRLGAILGFVSGDFPIHAPHHEKYGEMCFDDLPFNAQRQFLEYGVTVEMIEEATDEDVWKLFARLNRYTVPINRQETRHARFTGLFKQAVYALSEKHIEALRHLRVISSKQYSRMREAELISDILVAIIDGISDIQVLDDKYEQYDLKFSKESQATHLFSEAFERLANDLGETIRGTRFRNLAWFYSLMVASADTIGGIPGGYGRTKLVNFSTTSKRMTSLDCALRADDLTVELSRLRDALSKATSHVRERTTRHEHFYKLLVD